MNLDTRTYTDTHSHTAAIPIRMDWIDHVKGFTIFLVVYGHNFPFTERYIYSFHMPLFFMLAGFFHPPGSIQNIKRRFNSIIVPYFCWALLLYIFWFFLGRQYGDSAHLDLSPLKNFFGIFYVQGDRPFMDWGIPLWFLPALFCTFLLLTAIQKIKNVPLKYIVLALTITAGLSFPRITVQPLPWSIDVAMAALAFYALGFFIFPLLRDLSKKSGVIVFLVAGVVNLLLFSHNVKVDIYRSEYGNPMLFLLNGITGSLFVLMFFKLFPVFKFLGVIGKFSLVILALQLFALTCIKFVLAFGFGHTEFNFSETEKFLYAIVQLLLLVPAFYVINKFCPILNGGYKKI